MVKKISQAQITAGYYDLRQALSEAGCPLCRLLAGDADHHIDDRVAALTHRQCWPAFEIVFFIFEALFGMAEEVFVPWFSTVSCLKKLKIA